MLVCAENYGALVKVLQTRNVNSHEFRRQNYIIVFIIVRKQSCFIAKPPKRLYFGISFRSLLEVLVYIVRYLIHNSSLANIVKSQTPIHPISYVIFRTNTDSTIGAVP